MSDEQMILKKDMPVKSLYEDDSPKYAPEPKSCTRLLTINTIVIILIILTIICVEAL